VGGRKEGRKEERKEGRKAGKKLLVDVSTNTVC